MLMGFEDFKPIFGEPKAEWANSGLGSGSGSGQLLLHVHAPDSSHLRIFITDFHSNSWESVRSILQLEDMRDNIGIGGCWSDFIDYIIASIKSEDVKLVLEGHSNSDGAAKLVAQKSKGMPRIVFSLRKVVDSAATEAMANLSLELFKAFKTMQHLYTQEQKHSLELTKVISAEKEKNESIQSQLELHSKRQKSQKMNSSDKANVSAPLISNGQDSPDKQAARDLSPTKITNRVVPAYRRAKVRGVLLQDTEDDKDN